MGGEVDRASIAVIVAVRNGERTIDAAVTSVVEQSVRPAEVVVVDDASDDGTPARLAALAERHPEVRVITAPHRLGRSAARNLALASVTSELVAVQDGDDIALPWRFEEAHATFASAPDLVAVGAQVVAFDRPGLGWDVPPRPTDPADVARAFARGEMAIAHPTAVARRDVLARAGGYPVQMPYSEDLALFARVSALGPIASSPRVVTLYRSPRRPSFAHVYRTHRWRHAATRPGAAAPTASESAAAFALTCRVWVRQRVKPLPQERPLSAFGLSAHDGAGA